MQEFGITKYFILCICQIFQGFAKCRNQFVKLFGNQLKCLRVRANMFGSSGGVYLDPKTHSTCHGWTPFTTRQWSEWRVKEASILPFLDFCYGVLEKASRFSHQRGCRTIGPDVSTHPVPTSCSLKRQKREPSFTSFCNCCSGIPYSIDKSMLFLVSPGHTP